MGNRAPVHRTIQNCSVTFQGVYPNNSARLPNHAGYTNQGQVYLLMCSTEFETDWNKRRDVRTIVVFVYERHWSCCCSSIHGAEHSLCQASVQGQQILHVFVANFRAVFP